MNERASSKYAAFISYKHGADADVAAQLMASLENYSIPKRIQRQFGVGKRIGRIFRDREELAASSSLPASITEALDASSYLIVVCSPAARDAVWIEREIDRFVSTGRRDRVLAALVEGDPATAFPAPLGALDPLAIDLRAATPRERKRRLASERLRLLARLIGCDYDALAQRDHQRSVSRLRRLAVAAVVVAASAVALLAYVTALRHISEERRVEAEARLAAASHAMDQIDNLIENKFKPGVQAADLKPDLVALVADTERALASSGATGHNERVIEMTTHTTMGDTALSHSDWTTAAREYSTALQIGERVLATEPTNSAVRQDVAVTHGRLAKLAKQTGDKARSRKELQLAIDQTEKLLADVPQNNVVRGNLVAYNVEIGTDEQASGDDHARASFEKAIQVATARPRGATYIAEIDLPLAEAHEHLAELAMARNDLTSAITSLQAAVDLREQGTAALPEVFRGRDLAMDYVSLAHALERDHNYDGAIRVLDRALKYLDRVHLENPQLRDVVGDEWLVRASILVDIALSKDVTATRARLAQFFETDSVFQGEAQLDTYGGLAPYVEALVSLSAELKAADASESATAVARRALAVLDAARANDRSMAFAVQLELAEMPRLVAVLGAASVETRVREARGCVRSLDRATPQQALRCGYAVAAIGTAAADRGDLREAGERAIQLDDIGKHVGDLHSFDALLYAVTAENLVTNLLIAERATPSAVKISNAAVPLARELVQKAPDDAKAWTRLLLGKTVVLAGTLATGPDKLASLREAAQLLGDDTLRESTILRLSAQLAVASELLGQRDVAGARENLSSAEQRVGQYLVSMIPDGYDTQWLVITWGTFDLHAKLAIATNAKAECLASVTVLDRIADRIGDKSGTTATVKAAAERRAECDALK